MLEVKNKHITVLGLARSGVAAANILFELGAKVRISDIKPKEKLINFIDRLVSPDILVSAPADQVKDVMDADLVILSPGIPSDIPAVIVSKKNHIPVISEVELAYQLSKAPMVAITGSNGKTTTTSLVGDILKSTWKGPVAVAGNIGFPLCTAVRNMPKEGIIVAEISSFQLETIESFRPQVASILNITPNHLDRYPDMNAYANAKLRIFEYQKKNDFAVINFNDVESNNRIKHLKSQVVYFSGTSEINEGSMLRNQNIVFRKNGQEKIICDSRKLQIPGKHNLENALAASAIVACCGIEPQKMEKALLTFSGVEHRLEFIRELAGVKYYNDSKATTVTAVMTALSSLPAPVVWIAGGKDKGSDYHPLRNLASQKVKQLILIGQATEKIRNALNGSCPIKEAKSMKEAVQLAKESAVSNDNVVLSPACASFDMFADFEERGRVFKKEVSALSCSN